MSKSKSYKKFRASLQDFLSRLVETTAVSDVLYDAIFCETFQSWLVALSSSKLRAFRHTSTVITLFLVEALCEVSDSTQKGFSSLQRQKEAEVKRSAKTPGKSTRTGATDKTRLKELEALIKATHSNKMRLETYFKEIFDAVFIHRYRDAEPAIRMECIKSLGVWMTTLPDHFLEGNYLRYIGWMLTDLVCVLL
jgi:cohesin complex subunit SA-1/2